tara:strand:- start:571 stop:1959 length:1389 start_codon:yes stop_codon:yes gene_type:complete
MKKNVVFLTSVKSKIHQKKFAGYEWMDISKKTWEYFCKKNDCILYIYDTPTSVKMGMEYRVTWQRWFDVFKQLDENNIEFDKVFVTDSTTMVHWDCPNFFDLCDDRMVAWRDMANLNWIYYSIRGYESLMREAFDSPHFEFDLSKYINCGGIIINENHREFLNDVKQFYDDYKDLVMQHQDVLVKKGTDQTPFNYLLQMNKIDVNMDLPRAFNVNHLHRYDWISHNWQDGDDKTPFFLKYNYIWRATGIPKNQRTAFMLQVWDMVGQNYVWSDKKQLLSSVEHKTTFKNATSEKFKSDLIDFFNDDKYKDMTVLEIGCCHGDTTKILSKLFKKVYAVDWGEDNIKQAKDKCKDCDNVEFKRMDVSNEEWNFPEMDICFIDALHNEEGSTFEIEKVLSLFDNPVIVMDDYGNSKNKGMKNSINRKINDGILKVDSYIGEHSGFTTSAGWNMDDREGVIMRTVK